MRGSEGRYNIPDQPRPAKNRDDIVSNVGVPRGSVFP
jgi:hypothetical protein